MEREKKEREEGEVGSGRGGEKGRVAAVERGWG